ncbi:MAG TPA: F0F1 ATP synthase subunit beta, partial [Phycisphaerae bacterium]|nr:F0F1 ATP synthase subunit beta [Phycisphaerae bacterium]
MVASTENTGRVTQVIGSTLDAEFAEGRLPKIYSALRVAVRSPLAGEQTLWCEVAQHLGGGRVRAVALGSTDGL